MWKRVLKAGRGTEGFGPIEIIVGITAAGALAAVTTMTLMKKFEEGKRQTVRLEMLSLEASLKNYRIDMGRFPNTQEGLIALNVKPPTAGNLWEGPYFEKEGFTKDLWGNDYVYESNGHTFQLSSIGKDHELGTEDDVNIKDMELDVGNVIDPAETEEVNVTETTPEQPAAEPAPEAHSEQTSEQTPEQAPE